MLTQARSGGGDHGKLAVSPCRASAVKRLRSWDVTFDVHAGEAGNTLRVMVQHAEKNCKYLKRGGSQLA